MDIYGNIYPFINSKYHFNKHYCTIALSAVQYYCHLRVYFVLFQQFDARCC